MIRSTASSYYASVLHTLDNLIEGPNGGAGNKYVETKAYSGIYLGGNFAGKLKNLKKLFISLPGVNDGVTLTIGNQPSNAFAVPGTKSAEIMQLNFKTNDQEAELKAVKFKIQAVDAGKIERAYLMYDKTLISSSVSEDGYLEFSGFNYRMAANSKNSLSVKLDLAADLQANSRIRLDIEMPEDLSLNVGGSDYQINAQYPMRGKYLSVTNKRLHTEPIAIPSQAKAL